jgi:arabinofuranan 3-O-arabinosyltransferase
MAVDGDPATAWVVADRNDPLGQAIEVSATDGTLRLLQPQRAAANRRIGAVRISYPTSSAAPFDVVLDPASLSAPGQTVKVNPDLPVRITITSVEPIDGGTDVGPSAVGFAEIGVGPHLEWIRTPAVDTPVEVPTAVVLTRERVDPLNRWRSDPEPTMRRQFSLTQPHSFTGTVRLRLDARASDNVLNALDGSDGPVADRRLTGDPASRGLYAADGDADTAWTSPFGNAIGSSLTFTVDGSAGTSLRLQQSLDDLHSAITGVRITQGDRTLDLVVPAPDADGISQLTLDSPLERGTFTLVVTATSGRTTIDRRYAEPVELPVGISELTGDGITPTRFALVDHAPFCANGLLAIDGEPVGVWLDHDTYGRLLAGQAVERPLCEPGTVELAAGTHRVATTSSNGIQIDAVVLRPPTIAAPRPAPTVTVERTRLSRTVTVDHCPDGCWLVLGEGFNRGWSARVGDTALDGPVQIAGGFNGWWLAGSNQPVTVTLTWNAQTPVTAALVVSALMVLLCLWLAWRWPGRRGPPPVTGAPPRFDRSSYRTVPWRTAVAAGATTLMLTALVASPSTVGLAVLPVVLATALRRPRLLGVAGAELSLWLGAQVLLRQLDHRSLADAAWPSRFDDLHRAGMLVVVLLLAGALFADGDQATDS